MKRREQSDEEIYARMMRLMQEKKLFLRKNLTRDEITGENAEA